MLQLAILDSVTTARYDATKVWFPMKNLACSLQYKTDLYSPAWTDGRIDKPEVQQVIQDLIQYQKPFVKKYLIIIGLLSLILIVGCVVFFVLLANAFDNDTDHRDNRTFNKDLDFETNLQIGFGVSIVVWGIIYIVCLILKENIRRQKMSERAKQINPSFAARGLRWEVYKNCCQCGQATEIRLFKDYAVQPSTALAYLPPQGSYPM